MRRSTDLSAYNRALAFHGSPDGQVLTRTALNELAANELQLLYLFCAWAGATDVGYTMHGCGKKGPAFALPTRAQVDFALKLMR